MELAVLFLLGAFYGGWFADRAFGRRDDSDQQPKGKKSGVIVRTDYLTGVQYLEGPFGGLTVRVDADGKPIIAKPSE